MARMAGSGIARALRNRNYRIYISGNSISLIGSWMQRIAIGWLTWQLTESGAWLGLIAFADLFPSIILGPIGGAIADRWRRLRILKIASALRLLQAVTLTALTAADAITIEWLLGLTFATGIVAAVNQPARLALVPSLVREDVLTSAIAVNSVVFNLARFIGPAIGGLIIVNYGIAPTFAINAATYAIFLAFLFRIEVTEDHGRIGTTGPSFLASIGEGVMFALRHRGIAPLLLIMVIAFVLTRPFIELLPGFAAVVFDAGADLLAIFTSTVGIGAVIGGVWMAERGDKRGLTKTVLVSTAVSAGALLTFAAVDNVWIAIPALAIVGFSMVAYGIGTLTLLQSSVASDMRARIMSLYGLIFRGGPAIGAIALGGASEYAGLQVPVAVAAILVLLAAGIAMFSHRRIVDALEK
ncbi:MAG: MFS transporter [Proteobacteria bacterium]|nr:MFS transporter [Pseudomonadota bacterium]